MRTQITGLISEFLTPGVIIMFSIFIIINKATDNCLLPTIPQYMDKLTTNAAGSAALWAGLGAFILAVSYVVGILSNFLIYAVVHSPIDWMITRFVIYKDKDVYENEITKVISVDTNRWFYSKKLFNHMWGYICIFGSDVQNDINTYISFQRLSRGYIVALSLLWVATPSTIPINFMIPPYTIHLDTIRCLTILLVVLNFVLLCYTIYHEHIIELRVFPAVRLNIIPQRAVAIAPATAQVQINQTKTFTAEVHVIPRDVAWQVIPTVVAALGTNVGTITQQGEYTAPAVRPNPPVVMVIVSSTVDPTKFASATVTITNPSG